MSGNAQLRKRMAKELKHAETDGDDSLKINLGGNDNIQELSGIIIGPDETPYAGGSYEITVFLPNDYPFEPPKMKFKTKIWHPNVSSNTGAICMDVLADKWLPVMTVLSTLRSIQSLLNSPQPDDPMDAEVASMLKQDRNQFWTRAREWAVREAGAPVDIPEEKYRESWLKRMAEVIPADNKDGGADVYKSYNPVFVDSFQDMGFSASQVVQALDGLGVPPSHTAEGQHHKHNLTYAVMDWILEHRE